MDYELNFEAEPFMSYGQHEDGAGEPDTFESEVGFFKRLRSAAKPVQKDKAPVIKTGPPQATGRFWQKALTQSVRKDKAPVIKTGSPQATGTFWKRALTQGKKVQRGTAPDIETGPRRILDGVQPIIFGAEKTPPVVEAAKGTGTSWKKALADAKKARHGKAPSIETGAPAQWPRGGHRNKFLRFAEAAKKKAQGKVLDGRPKKPLVLPIEGAPKGVIGEPWPSGKPNGRTAVNQSKRYAGGSTMRDELNFEAESFQGYQGELEGYEGAELEGYQAEFESEFEFEDSKQNALDLTEPRVVRSVHDALSKVTGVELPKLDRIGPQAAGLLRTIQKQHRIKPNGVVGPNTIKALRRGLAGLTQGETAPDYELQGEVSRSSSTYIRWVQQSLNQVQSSGLVVDGVKGPKTTAAVKQFQQRRGLTADGIVGPITEAALVAAGAPAPPKTSTPTPTTGKVNAQLPASGVGFYSSVGASRRYGIPETIRALQQVAAAWATANPGGPRIGIGDISLQGGGPMSGHKSHQKGVDVDIRLMRNDGKEQGTYYKSASYSQALTQQLVDLIRNNGVLRVQYIFFNDPKVKGVSYEDGHHDHLHVRFYAP
jgi:peptidoglycan hydrolase-like protein with peptidoglycan-binding domain